MGRGAAPQYRQLFDEALGLTDDEVAVLCVLMLRGPQTPGELKQRTARLHPFVGLDEIHATLERLAARDLAERLPRRPGQKEERYRHRLGADAGTPGAAVGPDTSWVGSPATAAAPDLEARVAALEAEVARLRAALSAPQPWSSGTSAPADP